MRIPQLYPKTQFLIIMKIEILRNTNREAAKKGKYQAKNNIGLNCFKVSAIRGGGGLGRSGRTIQKILPEEINPFVQMIN